MVKLRSLQQDALEKAERRGQDEEIVRDVAKDKALREHFIPLRKADLVRRIIAGDVGLIGDTEDQFREFCRIVEATFHFEFHELAEDLKTRYAPFDPDADTIEHESLAPGEMEQRADEVVDRVIELLKAGNFRKVEQHIIEGAMEASSDWGVNLIIDFDVFARLEIYFRGDVIGKRTVRRWQRLWLKQEVEVDVYQRLVLMFRLNPHKNLDDGVSTEHVYVKIFKNVPKDDIDMLMPGGQVKMSLVDQGKIWVPTLSGTGLTLFKLIVAGFALPLYALLTLIAGAFGYGAKSFFGYLNTKNKYQLNLTRSLYYQNLDNNSGVFFRLIDEAEEQECREAFLAYYLLWRRAPEEGWTERQIDDAAEDWLKRETDHDVDFEVDDALGKLKRLGVVEESSEGRFTAVPIEESLRRLDHAWDNFFEHNVA